MIDIVEKPLDIELIRVDVSGSALAVVGTNRYEHTPGATHDSGTILADTLPIHYGGIDSGGTLTVGGVGAADSVLVRGTPLNDTMEVAGNTVDSRYWACAERVRIVAHRRAHMATRPMRFSGMLIPG